MYKQIKDPVHGYIRVGKAELELISSPVFRRLKEIRQLGMVDSVYPSATHNRFEHSLGTMHIAEEMFEVISHNSDRITREWKDKIVSQLKILAEEVRGVELKWKQNAGMEYLKGICRVLGLVHDIGHLPYSHTSELGLSTFLKRIYTREEEGGFRNEIKKRAIVGRYWKIGQGAKNAIHEGIGHLMILTSDIRRIINTYYGKGANELIYAIVEWPIEIVEGKNEDDGYLDGIKKYLQTDLLEVITRDTSFFETFQPLREIISGPIDADRLDYVQRDALESGLSPSRFDYGRLLENLQIYREEQTSRFRIGVNIKGLSGVTSFLIQRYFNYKWIYQHHVVALLDIVLGILIDQRFVELYNHEDKRILQLLEGNLFVDPWSKTGFTDGGLKFWIEELYQKLREEKIDQIWSSSDGYIRNPHLLFETFLHRRNLPVPLWRNWLMYHNLVLFPLRDYIKMKIIEGEEIHHILLHYGEKAKQVLPITVEKETFAEERIEEIVEYLAERVLEQLLDPTTAYSTHLQPELLWGEFEKKWKTEFHGVPVPQNIIVVRKSRVMLKKGSVKLLQVKKGKIETIYLEKASPLMHSLIERIGDQPHFHIFVQMETEKEREMIKTRLDEVGEKVWLPLWKQIIRTREIM